MIFVAEVHAAEVHSVLVPAGDPPTHRDNATIFARRVTMDARRSAKVGESERPPYSGSLVAT